MIEESFNYPLKGDGLKRILIGGIVTLLFFLILPLFIVYGYVVRTAKDTIEGEEDPPAWDDWGGMAVDGIKATVIGIAYGIVPMAVWIAIMVAAFGGMSAFMGGGQASANSAMGGLFAGVGMLAMLAFVPIFFVVAYLLPAAIVNFAATDSIGAAFSVARLKQLLFNGDYLVAVLLLIGINIAVTIVTNIIAAVTFGLGAILVPFVNFYVLVVIGRMFGQVYADIHGTQGEDETGTTAGAAV